MRELCIVLPALTLGLSCGGGAGTAGAFVDQYCELFTPCCQMANLPSDGSQCRAFLGAFTAASNYDRAAGEACLNDIRAASSKPDFCQSGSNSGSTACNQVFEGGNGGTAKPGESCTQDSDCAPSSEGKVDCRSRFVSGSETRKCQVQIRGTEGSTPCVGTVDGNITSYYSTGTSTDIPSRGYLCYVSDSLRCDNTSGACVRIKAAGEMCSGGSNECVKTAFCDTTMRLCVERKPAGSPCTSNTQCAAGTSCSSVTPRTCVPLLADGSACTQSGQCKSSNCVNGACAKSGGSDLGLALICGSR